MPFPHFYTFWRTMVLLCTLFFADLVYGSEKIQIYILSKEIQNEFSDKTLFQFQFPPGTELFDKTIQKKYQIRKPFRLIKDGIWKIQSEKEWRDFDILITGKSKYFQLNGNSYPFPLRIKNCMGTPVLLVEENLDQYAYDSGIVEIGINKDTEWEALHAVAQIIKIRARKSLTRKKNFPETKNPSCIEYHVSDLSDSQKYKGRKIETIPVNKWEIDFESLPGELFFHADSGGKTLHQSVFNHEKKGFSPIEDRILGKPEILLYDPQIWEARISETELKKIFENQKITEDLEIIFSQLPAEKFRLTVNRVKGWSFLRSNLYVREKKNNTYFFRGTGLGHNVGLNQSGAKKLSELGFSQYEILEHYFPEIRFKKNDKNALPYHLDFILFESNGKILKTSRNNLLQRKIPLGSIMKLFTTLMPGNSETRIHKRLHKCLSKKENPNSVCWYQNGHGTINWESALLNSCNEYFISLSKEIDFSQFSEEIQTINHYLHIEPFLPNRISKDHFPLLFAGLNFSVQMQIKDLMKLTNYLSSPKENDSGKSRQMAFLGNFTRDLLENIYYKGTANYSNGKLHGHEYKNDLPGEINHTPAFPIWGKTSTFIHGTNEQVGYGLFLGGYQNINIIVFLKKGNGWLAAQWARSILEEYSL